jgi:ectoine hydroxylase-related dioxygenase (phytanoyl-CoA dioxygenase family)
VVDLSLRHDLVSDLFQIPGTAEGFQKFRLSPARIESFQQNGFLTGIPVLDDGQIAALRDELSPLLDPEHPGTRLFYERHQNESAEPGSVLFHALGAWRISPGFHDLLWNPAVTVPASQLLGGAVRFWHDQLFVKPPRHGGVVAWHQDYSYWTRTEPVAHLTCWIPLDDANEENGCPWYVPGSHLWRLLPKTGLASDMRAIDAVLAPEERRDFRPVPAVLLRGHASFHHPLTVHGSYGNHSSSWRRGVALNFCRDGTRSASDDPLLEGVPPIPKGEKLGGRFFPLLYPGLTPRSDSR